MPVLLTGATGFLGQRVAKKLVEAGTPVRCLVRSSSDLTELRRTVGEDRWPLIDLVRGDLMDTEFCRQAVEGCEIVYHVAAGVTGAAAVMFLNTVIPTRRLMEAALAAEVKRFVLVSSMGVYGTQHLSRGSNVDETCPLDPQPAKRDAYSFSKITQEQAAWEMYARGLPLVVIRPGVIIGPGRGALSARVGLKLGPLQLRFGSFRELPYVYVDNCAEAVWRAGIADHAVGQAFNALDDNLPTGRQVLQAYRRCGRKVRSLWVPAAMIGPGSSLYEWYHNYSQGQIPGVITRYRSDTFWKRLSFPNTRAKQGLGWKPTIPMEEALRRSIRGEIAQ